MTLVLAVIALCCVASVVIVVTMLGPSEAELTEAADAAAPPAEVVLVLENTFGNRLCLDECLKMTRTYASKLSPEVLLGVMVAALERAGYRCVPPSVTSVQRDWCAMFEFGVLSYWHRPDDSVHIAMVVYPGSRVPEGVRFAGVPIDPGWRSYASLDVGPGAP